MENIKLENNYYLEFNNNLDFSNINFINVNNIKLNRIKKEKNLILKIDFNTFKEKEYKRILKRLLWMKKIAQFYKIEIGVLKENTKLLGYVINYNKNNKKQTDFILGINAILYNTCYDRYNYIYDTVCDYLDEDFYGKNLCDFKDNKCGEKRNTDSMIGCCHHFKTKCIGPLSKLVPCEYLKEDYTCSAKCISCKLFTCDYLEKKGLSLR